uniref:Uncharacterized protein n=1 Tax=Pseudo-nitzschia multistriata TaxID=183589 RepID=A0A448Z7X2_9STRA
MCQCCIVWAMSDAWIMCSMTIVALRLICSLTSIDADVLPLRDGAEDTGSEKAFSHLWFLAFLRSLSIISVAQTALTTS